MGAGFLIVAATAVDGTTRLAGEMHRAEVRRKASATRGGLNLKSPHWVSTAKAEAAFRRALSRKQRSQKKQPLQSD